MDEKLTKSLNDLIDETLNELEELRKSRFSAAEVDLKGPGADGIAGKPADGSLDAKKADEDEEDDEEDKKDMDKAEGKNEEAAKAEGKNEEAAKAESMDKKEDKKEDKKDEPHKDDPEHEEKEKKMAQKLMDMHKAEMKKSEEEHSSLMKSYVEERVKPLEDKLSTILDLVNKIADQPAPSKGVTARTTPLFKSAAEGGEALSKSEVASKLFELKKSGTFVDSLDVTKAEMGQDLEQIVKKYEIS